MRKTRLKKFLSVFIAVLMLLSVIPTNFAFAAEETNMVVKADLQGTGWKELYKWCGDLAENTNYTLSMMVKGSGAFWLAAKGSDWQPLASKDVTVTEDWSEVTLDFNTGANTGVNISVQDQVAAGTAYIDNVKVTRQSDNEVMFTEDFETETWWTYGSVYSRVEEPAADGGEEPDSGVTTEKETDADVNASTAHGGEYSMKLTTNGTTDSNRHKTTWGVPVEPSTEYEFSVWVKGAGSVEFRFLQSGDANMSYGNAVITGEADVWTKYTIPWTSPDSFKDGRQEVDLSFYDNQGSAGNVLYFDDLSLSVKGSDENLMKNSETLNSDFERGDLEYWWGSNDGDFQIVKAESSAGGGTTPVPTPGLTTEKETDAAINGANAHSGDYSMKLVQSGSGNWPYKGISIGDLVAGGEYEISVWVKGSGSVKLKIMNDWTSVKEQTLTGEADVWTKYTFTWTNSGNLSSINLMFYDQEGISGDGVLYIDDVSFALKSDGTNLLESRNPGFESRLDQWWGDDQGAFTAYNKNTAPPVESNPEGLANLGAYVWDRNPAGLADFNEWIGQDVSYVAEDFFMRDSWDYLMGKDRIEHWEGADSYERMMWATYPFPDNQGSLAEAANGDYNEYYYQLGVNLVEAGMADAIVRYGHEFNGNWYPWTVGTSSWSNHGELCDNFAEAFRQFVTTMRSVPGQEFEFCWNPTISQWGVDLARCYPGDDYVDVIGIDAYDQTWNNYSGGGRIYDEGYWNAVAAGDEEEVLKRQKEAWQSVLYGNWGLQDIDNFADEHNKPVGLCEWGLAARDDGYGGGDNVYYIEQMYNWINTNNVAWHVYFNVSAGDGDHDLYDTTRFPKASAKFQELWNPNGVPQTEPSVKPEDIADLPETYIQIEAEDAYYAGDSIGIHGDPWASNGEFVWIWKSLNCVEFTNVNASDGLTIVYQGWQSDLHASIYVNDIKVKDHVLFENHGRGWKDAYGYVMLNDLTIPEGANLKIQLDKTDEDNNWDNLKIDYILLHNAEGEYEPTDTATGPVGADPKLFPVHTGTHSLRLQQSGSGDWPFYINNSWFDLDANTDYEAKVWVKGTGSAALKIIDGSWSNPLATVEITGTDEWQEITLPFNSGSYDGWVGWVIYDDSQTAGDNLYFDDVYFGKAGTDENLLPNAGFEESGSWDPEGKGRGFFTIVEGTPEAELPTDPEELVSDPYRTSFTYSGVYGLVGEITGNGSEGGPSLNNKPTLKAGETYVYSAWVRGSGRMALVIQKAYGDWAEVLVQPATATDEWQKVVAVFTPAEDGQYNIKVGARDDSGNSGTVYVDDVLLTTADGSEVIVDSNFENGGSDWWIGEGFTCVDHSVSKHENTHSGSWVMQVSPSAATQWTEARINPDLPLEAGKTYHFSVWAKGNAEFAVQLTDTATWTDTKYETLTTTSGEWEEFKFDFTPSQTCGYMMKLINRSADGILYVDDLLMYTDGGNNLIANCDFELGDVNWNDRNAIFTIVNFSEIELAAGFIDELDNMDLISEADNVALDSASTGSYGGDTSRLVRADAGEGSIIYQLTEEDVNSVSIHVYSDEDANAADIQVLVSADGEDYSVVELTKDTYANAVDKTIPLVVYEAYNIPAGMKYLKIVLPENENVTANEISKVVVNASTMPVTAEPGSGNVDKGTEIVLTTGEADATILYTISGQSGTLTYTAPIVLEGSADITAWAVKDGKLDSIKRSYSYLDESEIIVDQYGQIRSAEFDGKIHNDEEFAAAVEEDNAFWESLTAPTDRDIYGGLAGSKEAYGFTETGYFHIEEWNGKSVMVDPLGNLYFHQGTNGSGYIDETYTQVTTREHVYEWLPDRDDPTYAAAWMGSDNFSFYVANMIRKNGSFSQEEFSELSDERMKLLGFTGAGAWSHSDLPSYEWLPMPGIYIPGTGLFDIFHPNMLDEMDKNFASLAANKDNPNIVAYLFGNELLYTSLKSSVPASNGADCGSKAKLIEMLQEKYGDIASFNEAWNTNQADWDAALTNSLSVTTEAAVQDMDAFTQVYLDELYKQVAFYAKKYDPNHMVGGDRWLASVMNDSKLRGYLSEAAGKYMDVLSYNYYTYDLNLDMIADMYEKSGGTPFIFTEFHYGDPTTGLTFAARMAENEEEKGLMYRNYVEKAAASGMVVGTNWFVYLDQAPTGRYFQGLTGEAGAIGLINVADRPYQLFLDSVMEANYNLYDLILGEKDPYQHEFSPAQGDREDNKVLEAPKTNEEITIGEFADWDVEPVLLTDRDLVLGLMKQGLGAEMKVMWDDEYYYFQAHISDPTPMLNKDAHPEGWASWIWDGDAIELFFGPDDVTEGGAMKLRDNQVLLAAVMGDNGEVHTKYYWNGYYSNIGEQPEIDVAAKLDDDGTGYMIEAKIKLSDIGVSEVGDGTLIRYDMGFDDGTMKGRERQFFWNGVDGNSSNREKWGMLKLVNEAAPPADVYDVTISDTINGTVTADNLTAAEGETVTLTITPDAGYEIDSILVNGGAVATNKVNDTTYTFTMPAGAVEVTVTFKETSSVKPPVTPSKPYYPPTGYFVNLVVGDNGTVTPGSGMYAVNTKQTFEVIPNAGYTVDKVLVDGKEIAVIDGKFTIYMAEPYRITVTFKEAVSVPGIEVGGSTATDNPQTGDSLPIGILATMVLAGGALVLLRKRNK